MTHNHIVCDTDKHFQIIPQTRKIVNASGKKKLMRLDHKSERFTFELPRYIEGHDMSLCNVLEVHFNNISEDGKEQKPNMDELTDIQISPDDESKVIFSWLITENCTQLAGILSFFFRFSCVNDDGTVDYNWNTDSYDGITVGDVEYNSQIVIDFYADIIHTWKVDIVNAAVAGAVAGSAEAQAKAEEAQRKAEQAQNAAETAKTGAEQFASNAENHATNAKTSEQNAVNAQNAAVEAARQAELSKQGANQSETNAGQFANNAEGSAKEAAESSRKAAQAEQNAAASAEESKKAAENAGGIKTVNGVAPDASGNVDIEAGGGVVYVTLDTETKKASHTKAEIQNLVESGKAVCLLYNNKVYQLTSPQEALFSCTNRSTDAIVVYLCSIADDGGYSAYYTSATDVGKVKYNSVQTLTDAQKQTARSNIGAVGSVNGVQQIGGNVDIVFDWDAAEGEPNHILNRTHYTDEDGTVHPLEHKYLPDGVPYVKENVLLEETDATETTDPTFGKVWMIGGAPVLTIGETYTVMYNGVSYNCVAMDGSGFVKGSVLMGNTAAAGGANTGEPFAMLVAPQQAIVCIDLAGSTSVKIGISNNIIQSVDYIVMRSSTPGSTKEFKLTVDDSGTITATEI